jgi:hypothetical protein
MLGVGGIGGMDMSGVDLSAWVGMSGVGNVPGATATPTIDAPQGTQVGSIGMGTNLQSLVQTLQQFSQAEVMLALFLAFSARHTEQRHAHHSALDGLTAFALAATVSQPVSSSASFESASVAASIGGQAAMSINVAG